MEVEHLCPKCYSAMDRWDDPRGNGIVYFTCKCGHKIEVRLCLEQAYKEHYLKGIYENQEWRNRQYTRAFDDYYPDRKTSQWDRVLKEIQNERD